MPISAIRAVVLGAVMFAISARVPRTPQLIVPAAALVVDHSVRVQPGTYRVPAPANGGAALTVRGENVSVDLTGVTIEGGDPFADPDTYRGTGILIDGGRGVTLRGGSIRGYKVAIRAQQSPALHITGADLSHNWKPRLLSGIEKENQADWLSFHNNEKDEWLRYGAAIYLSECDDAEVDNTRAVQGMDGLMVTRSARLKIWNNTFSWNSGVGIGLYRTTDSTVMHNRLDYDVRGYSHGFYARGQDSTGILLYEQSSHNVVAYNSITHGGDGVFLWAGQSTMDTGQGGANDNMFYGNDVSHAVANGIEATFSRNSFLSNRIEDCWHGIWGGYSYDSLIEGNTFTGNTDGIAIEHGQNIHIHRNTFARDETAIRIWANATEDPNWGYPKTRDTRSRDYVVTDNRFDGEKTALDLMQTTGIRLERNDYKDVAMRFKQGADVQGIEDLDGRQFQPGPLPYVIIPMPIPGGMDAKLPAGARRGRDTIIVDDWGPYDYKSPKLWPAGKLSDRPLKLRVLGPEGKWTLRSVRGASALAKSGAVPGEIALTPSGPGADLSIELEYVGAEVVTPRGQVIAAGTPSLISYRLFDPAIDWTVKFWKFDAASDPLAQPAAFSVLLATPPVKTNTATRLDYSSPAAFGNGFENHIGVTAEGGVNLAAGTYELSVTSDDGIRVWIDERLVLEDWSIHGPKEDRLPMTGGRHRLRIEYFQNTGAAALQLQVTRK